MNTLTKPKSDAVRENALLDLQEQIENECYYKDVVSVWDEYLEDNLYEDQFYHMNDFEHVCGDSFKKLFPKLSVDFTFDSEGFWFRNGKIHSGDAATYYSNVVKYDLDEFTAWVYDNGYQKKLGLEVE